MPNINPIPKPTDHRAIELRGWGLIAVVLSVPTTLALAIAFSVVSSLQATISCTPQPSGQTSCTKNYVWKPPEIPYQAIAGAFGNGFAFYLLTFGGPSSKRLAEKLGKLVSESQEEPKP